MVIRFSSLGDIVLAGSVTGALEPVVFLTSARYAEIAAALPGVVEVRTWEESGRSALDGVDHIIDLHASLRSRWATFGHTGTVRRAAKHSALRRSRVMFKMGSPPPTVIARYAAAAQVEVASHPWLPQANGDTLLLIPGAQHATKRWPAERFVDLGRRWTGPIAVLGSHDEKSEVECIAASIGPSAFAIAENGFSQTLSTISKGRCAVGGDTGLMHLCAAAGVPTIGLFGPTTSTDGFWCHPGVAVEVPLPCRPCTRHGGPECPIGDHKCMTEINVDTVWAALGSI
jgi:ADP-heptose:LPS heptosyltransferase